MLWYNIYKNISDNKFEEIRGRLSLIENKMVEKLSPLGWDLTEPVSKNEALIVDFTIDEEDIRGNIGFTCEDEPGEVLFYFYITKGCEDEKKPTFVKKRLFEGKPLSFYEDNIVAILEDVLYIYHSWDKQYIEQNNISDEYGD